MNRPSGCSQLPIGSPVPSPPNPPLSETRDLLNDAGMKRKYPGLLTESTELRPQALAFFYYSGSDC
jgi:hypothetical protein